MMFIDVSSILYSVKIDFFYLTYYMNTILILLFVLLLFYSYLIISNILYHENFMVYWSGPPVDSLPDADNYTDNYTNNYTNWPWENMRIGQTSNMSYDLRGDPIQIPKYPFMWNYSTLTPIYNKKLC